MTYCIYRVCHDATVHACSYLYHVSDPSDNDNSYNYCKDKHSLDEIDKLIIDI